MKLDPINWWIAWANPKESQA